MAFRTIWVQSTTTSLRLLKFPQKIDAFFRSEKSGPMTQFTMTSSRSSSRNEYVLNMHFLK